MYLDKAYWNTWIILKKKPIILVLLFSSIDLQYWHEMWNNTNWLNWPWQRNSANCYNKHCFYERYKLLWRTVAAKGITTVVQMLMINSVFTIWITISVQFANMAILFRPIGSQKIKLVSFSIFWFWASPDEDWSYQ
jgi:hypothetical protein